MNALNQKDRHPDKDDHDQDDRVFDEPRKTDPRPTMPLEFGVDRRHAFLVLYTTIAEV